jgi:hypothetical protein
VVAAKEEAFVRTDLASSMQALAVQAAVDLSI